MAHDIRIPPEVVEAGARALIERRVDACVWVHLSDESKRGYQEEMRAAFLAMIEAWPGMFEEYMNDEDGDGASLCVILPLEASDE